MRKRIAGLPCRHSRVGAAPRVCPDLDAAFKGGLTRWSAHTLDRFIASAKPPPPRGTKKKLPLVFIFT